ncbi:hypothetical protein CkaCkLH20_11382 [Colletotrichum karsti]|uniref:LysM domain-containing protein n=1 Tax=Colletotrichum karsti TaxID=1095194 RepID=A0A9P6LF80_9PEZI|nr:uncharacterized protein CkaCkLH20_11382 [Colletotrichum karsti]KAF9871213.1 hypothetical protein CkaCkLH20_11382 [Colletotrichum karsti]
MIRLVSLAVFILFGTHPVHCQNGFALYNATNLDVTLGTGCVEALSTRIGCDPYVQSFAERGYRGPLPNTALTDAVCTSDCSGSLKAWFNDVTTRCQGMTLDDSVPNRVGGYLWAGFNETCVKDPKTKKYCNDIIANFTAVSEYKKMPQDELCHTCHVRRIALMQSSQYSTYDGYYKELLEYIYSKCNAKGPTDIPPPLTKSQPEEAPYCVTGKRYITKKGDTCESIANATSVSSAAIYMGNQQLIPNCLDIDAGVSVCVPLTCQTYYVRPSDTCVSIEMALGLEFDQIRTHNQWLYFDCSNLQDVTGFWGRIICVSPQGGTYTGTVPAPAPTEAPLGDGYTRNIIAPPEKAKVASGTTLNCGKWHVVADGDTCSKICIQEGIEASLFRLVNPSLVGSSCTASLQPSTALCVGPTYSWNSTISGTSSHSVASSSVVSSSKKTSSSKAAVAMVASSPPK